MKVIEIQEKNKRIKRKDKEKKKLNKNLKNSGVVSIYLCLMLIVLLTVVLIMIEGARVNGIKSHSERTVDMAMDSILAEYHRELFNRYGVLFVDSSYGEKYGNIDNVTDRFKDYAEYNLMPSKGLLSEIGSRDLLGLSIESVDVLSESRATDNKGEVFKYMAGSYMLERFGIGYIDYAKSIIEVSDSNKLLEGDIIAENESAQRELYSKEMPTWQDEEGEWHEYDRCNPTTAVNEARSKGILSLVCDNTVSNKTVDLSDIVSKRNIVSGQGLNPNWKKRSDIETELLFIEYILLKCGNYTNIISDSLLDYQVEYIIAGKNSDTDNLKNVSTKLLLIRGASNTIYFTNHPKLKEQASLLAEGLSIITLMPDLKDVYETAIVAAWIFSESAYDVKALMNGKRIPLIKGEYDWNLSLDKALLMTAGYVSGVDGNVNKNTNGQNYSDYLRILLYAMNKDERTMRCMDIVEMDIRKITGKNSFSLDDCIASFNFQIVMSSSYGYSFIANRSCSYW